LKKGTFHPKNHSILSDEKVTSSKFHRPKICNSTLKSHSQFIIQKSAQIKAMKKLMALPRVTSDLSLQKFMNE
jgi:hypothetical protein